MKKSLFSFLTLLLVFLLVSCNTVPEVTTGSTAGTTAATTVGGLFATTQATTEYETTTSEDDEYEEPQWILNTTNRRTYSLHHTGVMMRELTIKTHLGGDPVVISQLTDTHIIYFNEQDLADPFYKSVYDAYNNPSINGWPLSNVRFTMSAASKDADAVVVTGDVVSCYSSGSLQKANEYIFSKHDNVLAALGNHDVSRVDVHGHIPDPMSMEDLRFLLAGGWSNDIAYESQVIGDKVMAIVIDNSLGFRDEQVPRLTADLATAREMGYIVLMFYHVPLCTGLEEDNNLAPEWGNHQNWPFGTTSAYVGPHSKGVDAKIYSMIRRNGDIIRGLFCGHVHGDFYMEIPAKTIDGIETMIPQYVMTPVMSNSGHFLRITVE